ncbi:sulfite exporter TauE/SafE family protein [Oceanobacillus jeddahense]|uniref:sulfite exporter TauE/SafE family protein n=1 Tax=Oceanobacillus jeddahense TaxID=1462527 RepID=UPI000595B8D2|nr:sulfite exporter TauE/SafE family protein [Oceanobacillus jeddahense]
MLTFFIVFIANLIIGILVGLSGVSGFLLPIIYVGFLGLPVHDSLALSFLAFLVAGIIGAYSYWKLKYMDFKLALYLSIGSLPGAFLGVQINVLISETLAKLLLYLFVLFAGLSIILKKNNARSDSETENNKSFILKQPAWIILLGILTAAICALTGAGGPILVVPLLASLGVNIRTAVGVGLLNSVVIALPSIFGYFTYASIDDMHLFILFSLIGTTIGILTGSRVANKVPVAQLKIFIAIITIISSVYMLGSLAWGS